MLKEDSIVISIGLIRHGYVPDFDFNHTEELPEFVNANKLLLQFKNCKLYSDLCPEIITDNDIHLQLNYIEDLVKAAKYQLKSTKYTPLALKYGLSNPHLLALKYTNKVANKITSELKNTWQTKLNGFSDYSFSHAWLVQQSLQLD